MINQKNSDELFVLYVLGLIYIYMCVFYMYIQVTNYMGYGHSTNIRQPFGWI